MAQRYYSTTAKPTTLNGAVTNVAGSITLAASPASLSLPSNFPYTLILDPGIFDGSGNWLQEIVEVTSAGAGNALNVTRHVDGTSGVAHANGAGVLHGVSGRDLSEPNTHVNDDTLHLGPKSMVVTGGSVSIASDANYHAATMNARVSGTSGLTWSSGTNPSRITVDQAGTYLVVAKIIWPGTLGTTDARGHIRVSGTQALTSFNTIRGSSGNSASVAIGFEVCANADYLECFLNQASGSAVSITSSLFGVFLLSTATS